MLGKRYRPEEVILKLREAEVYLTEGMSVGEVIRRLGVTNDATRKRGSDLPLGITRVVSQFEVFFNYRGHVSLVLA